MPPEKGAIAQSTKALLMEAFTEQGPTQDMGPPQALKQLHLMPFR